MSSRDKYTSGFPIALRKLVWGGGGAGAGSDGPDGTRQDLLCPPELCVVLVLTCSTENGFGLEYSMKSLPSEQARWDFWHCPRPVSHPPSPAQPSLPHPVGDAQLFCKQPDLWCQEGGTATRPHFSASHRVTAAAALFAAGICILWRHVPGPSLLFAYLVVVSLTDGVGGTRSTAVQQQHAFPGFFPRCRSRLVI